MCLCLGQELPGVPQEKHPQTLSKSFCSSFNCDLGNMKDFLQTFVTTFQIDMKTSSLDQILIDTSYEESVPMRLLARRLGSSIPLVALTGFQCFPFTMKRMTKKGVILDSSVQTTVNDDR